MRSNSWQYVITVLLLAGTLAASKLSERRQPESLARSLDQIPINIGSWTGADAPPLGDAVLQVLRPTSYLDRRYERGADQISLFIAYYAEQRAGESMHSPKHCLPGGGWEIWSYGSAWVPVEGRQIKINRYSIQHNDERLLVLYWYQSKQRIIASEYLGKILLVRDAMAMGSTSGSLVRLILRD
jgi:EpsI family protein